MRESKNVTQRKGQEKSELYLSMMFSLMKKREFSTGKKNGKFSNTELRLLAEVLSAQYEGKRLISTQLAEIIGVTRSAVSQIVNRLEEEGVVKRVADAVDRKIAYIEVTESALVLYKEELDQIKTLAANIVERYGEEKFQRLCADFEEFMLCVQETKTSLKRAQEGKKSKKKA